MLYVLSLMPCVKGWGSTRICCILHCMCHISCFTFYGVLWMFPVLRCGLGVVVLGFRFKVEGLGFRGWRSGFRVQGSGFRFQGLGWGPGNQELRKLNAEGSNNFSGSKNQLQFLKQSISDAQIISSGCSNNQFRLLKQSIPVAQTIKFGCPNNQIRLPK